MKPGNFYMHKNSMDVALLVLGIRTETLEETVLEVLYYNVGYTGNPWVIEENNNFVVKNKDIPDYIEISRESLKIPRTKSGLPDEK